MSKIQIDSSRSHMSTRRAKSALWFAVACGLLLAVAANAGTRTKGITGGLESGTDLVTLPSSPGGSFLARECRDCPSIRVSFDSNTLYLIGDEPVTYAKFREAASKGDLRLHISYRLTDRTLTRLRLPAAGK
jgi:hypothetical protein